MLKKEQVLSVLRRVKAQIPLEPSGPQRLAARLELSPLFVASRGSPILLAGMSIHKKSSLPVFRIFKKGKPLKKPMKTQSKNKQTTLRAAKMRLTKRDQDRPMETKRNKERPR